MIATIVFLIILATIGLIIAMLVINFKRNREIKRLNQLSRMKELKKTR